MADVKERAYWKDYQEAYEEMIQNTAYEMCAMVNATPG